MLETVVMTTDISINLDAGKKWAMNERSGNDINSTMYAIEEINRISESEVEVSTLE